MIDELMLEFGPALSRHQIELREENGEVVVEATLLTWDEIGPAEEQALEAFLRRAEGEMRFVECRLQDGAATLVARLNDRDIDVSLPHTVARLIQASRALSREAAALLRPELAGEYSRFQREIPATAGRI